MVQHEAVRWICSNWDREASVSNMEASLCMKKIENRGSIVQLKMMQDLITREKQICKKSLPVHVVLMWDLYQFMEVESLILHLFSPCHRDRMWIELPKKTVNQADKSKFLNDIESYF